MSLATKLWVTSPGLVGPLLDEFWQYGRELVYRFSDRSGPAIYTERPTVYGATGYAPGTRDRDHEMGQGFCSMYDLRYHPLGLLAHPAATEPEEGEGYILPLEALSWYVRVDLDTTYGFRTESPDGRATWGCGDVHAAIVGALGRFLTDRGLAWSWYNEFTGEVHEGPVGLDDLGQSGAEAHNWLENIVKPAVNARTDGKVQWL